MNAYRAFCILAALFLFGCTPRQSTTLPEEVVRGEVSRFSGLELKIGMNREQVEEKVAALLGKQKTYSPYGNNLRGGTVRYRDEDWVLEIVYKAGAPAPWIMTKDGKAQHYPPVDESVLEFKIERIPNKPSGGDVQ